MFLPPQLILMSPNTTQSRPSAQMPAASPPLLPLPAGRSFGGWAQSVTPYYLALLEDMQQLCMEARASPSPSPSPCSLLQSHPVQGHQSNIHRSLQMARHWLCGSLSAIHRRHIVSVCCDFGGAWRAARGDCDSICCVGCHCLDFPGDPAFKSTCFLNPVACLRNWCFP